MTWRTSEWSIKTFKKSGSFFIFWFRDPDWTVSWDEFGFVQVNPDELDTSDLVDVVSHQLRVVEFHVPAEKWVLESDIKDDILHPLWFVTEFVIRQETDSKKKRENEKERARNVIFYIKILSRYSYCAYYQEFLLHLFQRGQMCQFVS
jgi:hypothetical protein